MIAIRRAEERGHFDQAWVAAYHTFSFDHYRDPDYNGFRTLRALNEERVQPGCALPRRSDEAMEILSYVLEGALEERDTSGNSAVIRPGELRVTSARPGETRAELNPSSDEPVRYLQFWLQPAAGGKIHAAEQRLFSHEEKRGKLRLLASADGREGSLRLGQGTEVYASVLAEGERVLHALRPGSHAWVQVVRGAVELNGRLLTEGDGAAMSDVNDLALIASKDSEVVVLDLA